MQGWGAAWYSLLRITDRPGIRNCLGVTDRAACSMPLC